MRKFKILSLLMAFVMGITMVTAQDTPANVAITLERTACFGTCPVYTISILEDGTVNYEGTDYVEVTGQQTSQIDPETVTVMVQAFDEAGYFDWDEAYDTMTVSDMPTVITSVTRDGETHTITRYVGDDSAPMALPFLEQWIDTMVNSQLWTGVQPDPSVLSNGTDTPLATLKRDACFGFCPVYTVALYEDGTIVYAGIANVETLGVQIIESDPFTVTNITQIAEISGYFNWQDSYEERLMTDQATITTTIRNADQFKKIVRYDGDPNAPIGLVRIEENIARAVADFVG